MAALSAMQTDPLSGDVVKLAGQDAFRRRVSNYRIIFRIEFKGPGDWHHRYSAPNHNDVPVVPPPTPPPPA
jgi:hypothetical protein